MRESLKTVGFSHPPRPMLGASPRVSAQRSAAARTPPPLRPWAPPGQGASPCRGCSRACRARSHGLAPAGPSPHPGLLHIHTPRNSSPHPSPRLPPTSQKRFSKQHPGFLRPRCRWVSGSPLPGRPPGPPASLCQARRAVPGVCQSGMDCKPLAASLTTARRRGPWPAGRAPPGVGERGG